MLSVYLHIPFCVRRCAYCDFNTYAGLDEWMPAYIEALKAEMVGLVADKEKLPVHTVFLGGGTPSLLAVEQVNDILMTVRECFEVHSAVEISMEANPGTVSLEGLSALRKMGVNRLSFGVQSFRAGELALLGRIHTVDDALRAVAWARQAGFDNLNLDLIFGLPEQTLENWQQSVNIALDLQPEHLSLYALTIEEGTPLYGWVERGLVRQPDDDLAADMYEWASERLEAAGYAQYEISNWAREGRRCQHNLQYWHNLQYLGFGAGAHSFVQGYRLANLNGIREYIQAVKKEEARRQPFPLSPANLVRTLMDPLTEIRETMMVGLRLTEEGVGRRQFEERFEISLEALFADEISRLEKNGLVEFTDRLRLTKRGRLLGNLVFAEFVNAPLEPLVGQG